MENIIVVQLEEITDISCRQWTADGVEDKFDHSVKINPTSDLITFGYIFIDNSVVDISEVVISQLIINFCQIDSFRKRATCQVFLEEAVVVVLLGKYLDEFTKRKWQDVNRYITTG